MNTETQENFFDVDDEMSWRGMGRGASNIFSGTVVLIVDATPSGDSLAPSPDVLEECSGYVNSIAFNPFETGRNYGRRHYLVDCDGVLHRPSLSRIICDAGEDAEGGDDAALAAKMVADADEVEANPDDWTEWDREINEDGPDVIEVDEEWEEVDGYVEA